MKVISLNKGNIVVVDDEDFESNAQFRWFISSEGYAVRNQMRQGVRKTIYLHREIMGATKGQQVDHKNGNRLDCRRENLRFATHLQNCLNKCVQSNNVLGIKGVRFHPKIQKFTARIRLNGVERYLGSFKTSEEASAAYKTEAIKLHGEFARLN